MNSTGKLRLSLFLGLALVLMGNHRGLGKGESVNRPPVKAGATIADELLSMEFRPGETSTDFKKTLDDLIEAALAKFESTTPSTPETEHEKATRFFRAVDQTLIAHHCIYPPMGFIDLLRSALTPRTLTVVEYHSAAAKYTNRRRLEEINQSFESGVKLYYMDCDLSAIIYKAVGERAGFPIEFVEVPTHNFVRWSSPTLKMNWDTNDACVYTDEYYVKRWHVTEIGKKYMGWLQDMPRADIKSYWWGMIAYWHKRHGRYDDQLAALRSAMKASPGNLCSMNLLAWFLATCPDARLRNGKEAEAIAQKVVSLVPSADWLSTLAAAQAEKGDFKAALTTEQKAMAVANSFQGVDFEHLGIIETCIQAYTLNLTYRQAVEQGLVQEPKKYRPYDD